MSYKIECAKVLMLLFRGRMRGSRLHTPKGIHLFQVLERFAFHALEDILKSLVRVDEVLFRLLKVKR